MKNVRMMAIAGLVGLALAVGGCSTIGRVISTVTTELTTRTPAQVSTYADALQAATLVTKAVDIYVNAASPDRATLLELQKLNEDLHTALSGITAANTAGQSLTFAAFNAALAAFNSYATSQGVSH